MRWITLVILFFLSSALYSQETDVLVNENGTPYNQGSLFEFIIHSDSLFNPFSFRYFDGTSLSMSELNRIIDIPENQTLVKGIKQTGIASIILNVVIMAATGGIIAYSFGDLPHADIMKPVLYGVAGGSVIINIGVGMTVFTKYMRAIDNYNLSIIRNQNERNVILWKRKRVW
jgi:hypothetical protein